MSCQWFRTPINWITYWMETSLFPVIFPFTQACNLHKKIKSCCVPWTTQMVHMVVSEIIFKYNWVLEEYLSSFSIRKYLSDEGIMLLGFLNYTCDSLISKSDWPSAILAFRREFIPWQRTRDVNCMWLCSQTDQTKKKIVHAYGFLSVGTAIALLHRKPACQP